jgi:hypothetical protein
MRSCFPITCDVFEIFEEGSACPGISGPEANMMHVIGYFV